LLWEFTEGKISSGGHEKHSDDGKNEHRYAEDRDGKSDARLFKFPRRAGEEEHGR